MFHSQKESPPGGLEPPTYRLTAERASQLRHGGIDIKYLFFIFHLMLCRSPLNK
jgi:hypothetical protein